MIVDVTFNSSLLRVRNAEFWRPQKLGAARKRAPDNNHALGEALQSARQWAKEDSGCCTDYKRERISGTEWRNKFQVTMERINSNDSNRLIAKVWKMERSEMRGERGGQREGERWKALGKSARLSVCIPDLETITTVAWRPTANNPYNSKEIDLVFYTSVEAARASFMRCLSESFTTNCKPTLILCLLYLIDQWLQEINRRFGTSPKVFLSTAQTGRRYRHINMRQY